MDSCNSYPRRWVQLALGTCAAALVIAWLALTPPGILSKADAIGYSVCHRIPSHSFSIGGRPLPLCARCSGMYLGALLGLAFFFTRGRRGGLPLPKYLVILAAFAALFILDGVNSYLHFFPHAPWLYPPENWLRLATGLGMGIGISSVLMPLLNGTFFAQVSNQAILSKWQELAVLSGLAVLVAMGVISEIPVLEVPLALLSAFSVLLLLTLLYAALWVIVTHHENRYTGWRQAWFFLLAGFSTAMLQIAGIDWLRFMLTHTWNGFVF